MTERDEFIQSQIGPMLMPGERVLHTAYMVRQPGLLMQILLVGGLLLVLMTKAYYAAFTDRRLILIRTKQGFFKPKMVNIGVEQYDAAQMSKCTVSGFANNRSMTFHFQDRSKQTLRIHPWTKWVTGTKAFFEQVPQLINSGQLAAGAQAAGAFGQGAQPGMLPQGMPPQGMPPQGMPPQGMPPQGMPGQGFAPGAQVMVTWTDGNRYPATVVQAQGGQYLCSLPNGQQQWVPGQSVSSA